MYGLQDHLERGYSDGAICADCGCGTSQLDERDLCRGCAEAAAHDESAQSIEVDAALAFERDDEALFAGSPSIAELDAWADELEIERLDRLTRSGALALYSYSVAS